MGPEEKLPSAGSTTPTVDAGQNGTCNLGPSQHTYDDPRRRHESDQAIKVNLPKSPTAYDYATPPRARTPGGPVAATTCPTR